MVETEAQRRANLRSKRKNVVQLNVPLFRSTDGDIIDHLAARKELGDESQSDYIRRLIREDMMRKSH